MLLSNQDASVIKGTITSLLRKNHIEKLIGSSPALTSTSELSYQKYSSRIKGIKTIKGFKFINNEIHYEVEAWDQNGQTIFVPPLRSEDAKRIDI